jgi:predicted nucleic acid-binding protein
MLLDTSRLLCMVHRREPQHERAVSLYNEGIIRLTHNYVLDEFVSLAHARHFSRQPALDFSETSEGVDGAFVNRNVRMAAEKQNVEAGGCH